MHVFALAIRRTLYQSPVKFGKEGASHSKNVLRKLQTAITDSATRDAMRQKIVYPHGITARYHLGFSSHQPFSKSGRFLCNSHVTVSFIQA
jgi:hypothetical protein